jgi:hypothetical protein
MGHNRLPPTPRTVNVSCSASTPSAAPSASNSLRYDISQRGRRFGPRNAAGRPRAPPNPAVVI